MIFYFQDIVVRILKLFLYIYLENAYNICGSSFGIVVPIEAALLVRQK